MLSKNKIKFINSIKKKKYRDIHQCFFVEGEKIVDELLHSDMSIIRIFATSTWIQSRHLELNNIDNKELVEITDEDLKKISALSTPNKVMAVAKKSEYSYTFDNIKSKLNLFLDNINDPGNLGTIIRIADWFGIEDIFCSLESVDVYNPKVVQASMGAIYRTKVHYVDSIDFLQKAIQLNGFNIYGTFLEGKNIYEEELKENGLIILGSESHGITENLKPFINKKLFIPSFPSNMETSESLNISIAAAITCAEFRRRAINN
ncbi:MAG: RNA methyltransferase [Marinilabiliales bacterium]|nr:MAG: RNA methyltransferase [Marinilabiliales bacterium]